MTLHFRVLNLKRFLSIQPVKVHFNAAGLWCISHSFKFRICELAEGALCPVIQAINEDVEQHWLQQ